MGCDAVMSVSAISSQMASSGMGCLVPAVSGGFGGGGIERESVYGHVVVAVEVFGGFVQRKGR